MGSKKNAKVTDVKHRIYQITYMSLVTTIYLLLINPFISFDGWQYISSAKSLFDRNEMAQHYFWVREPGFPLLVKMFSINGSFLWGVIIFNFILFMLSFFYFYIQVMKSIKLNRNLEHFCLAVSYIGSVTLVGIIQMVNLIGLKFHSVSYCCFLHPLASHYPTLLESL
jgi:hypothetical protein